MAAFWNIVLPYEIHFENKPENQQFFDQNFADDYFFKDTRNYETVREASGNGTRKVFKHCERQYALKHELLKKELIPFFKEIVQEFENQYRNNPNRGFESKFFYKDIFSGFLESFENTPLETFTEAYIDMVKSIKNNSYIFFDKLFSMIVFEGFAFPNDFTVFGVSLLSSHDPMNLMPQETLAFHNFTNFIHDNLKDKYKIAKYVFNAGY